MRQSITFPLPVAVDELRVRLGSIFDSSGSSSLSMYAGLSYTIDIAYTVGQYPTSKGFQDRLELHFNIYNINTVRIPIIEASDTYDRTVSFNLPTDYLWIWKLGFET